MLKDWQLNTRSSCEVPLDPCGCRCTFMFSYCHPHFLSIAVCSSSLTGFCCRFFSLGDILCTSLDPPQRAAVFSCAPDTDYLKPPADYELVWRNREDKRQGPVSIWRPVPPPGYVSMGCLALGAYCRPSTEESRLSVQCVRMDLVQEVTKCISEPVWISGTNKTSPWSVLLQFNDGLEGVFTAQRLQVSTPSRALNERLVMDSS